jgi:hypothetical protein
MVPRIHAYPASPTRVASALREASARALETGVNRAEEVAPGLEITTSLLSGPPALAVAACGSGAAMLVVGARGAGGFAAMVLGSVSRYAAIRAACPVIVARRAAMAVHQEVVVGIRDSEDAKQSRRSRQAAGIGTRMTGHRPLNSAGRTWPGTVSSAPTPRTNGQTPRTRRLSPSQTAGGFTDRISGVLLLLAQGLPAADAVAPTAWRTVPPSCPAVSMVWRAPGRRGMTPEAAGSWRTVAEPRSGSGDFDQAVVLRDTLAAGRGA